jgi:hypothetical protein
MSPELVSRALRDLRERVARESDPEELRELVIDINALLDLIEEQLTKLEGRPASSPPLNGIQIK